jgi:hypothetical protein
MATLRTLSATLIATVTIAGLAESRLGAADKPSSIAAVRSVHVMIANPVVRQRVELAIRGASQRLDGRECQKLFTDFQDGAGQPLQARLDGIHLTGAEFLTWLRFAEGEALPLCTRTTHVAAFTQPGSRVIQVCGGIFARQSTADSQAGEILIIHELLHTLGLEENPPSSADISRRVLERCSTQPVQRKPI